MATRSIATWRASAACLANTGDFSNRTSRLAVNLTPAARDELERKLSELLAEYATIGPDADGEPWAVLVRDPSGFLRAASVLVEVRGVVERGSLKAL